MRRRGLSDGDNPEDEEWEQRLESLELAADYSTVRMVGGSPEAGFMLLPNDRPARAYMSWEGTLAATGGMICD